ncbi:ABC transporter permease [Solwaraspora sp. WMMA2101]|uniref:ABC transporter permease n=1 Tax=Solwaraspora sp. WMMA2101 TaxID=3404124 RepID=UPI003B959D8C
MAYDDSPYRRRSAGVPEPGGHGDPGHGDPGHGDPGHGDPGHGYSGDPGYGDPGNRTASGYQTSSFTTAGAVTDAGAGTATTTTGRTRGGGRRSAGRRSGHRRPAPGLDDVFDDPRHGEPGRDRLAVHVVWETILLAVVGGLGYLLYQEDPTVTGAAARDPLLVYATGLGLLVLAAGVSLRAGAPNLAIGPVAIAAALHFAENGDNGVLPVLVTAGIWAVVLGVLTAVLVTGLQMPGWAGSLVAACVAVVFIQQRAAPVDLQGAFDPTGQAVFLFGGFVAVAVLGGILGTVKPVRRGVGRFRPVADPALRRGATAAMVTSGALVVSMGLAVGGGVLLAAVGGGPVSPSVGLEWSALAIGAALLGGTSVFGRRGGIFGAVFAVVGLTIFIRYADLRQLDIALYATAAVTLAVGLVVTRLVETFGRPRVRQEVEDAEPPPEEEDEWVEPPPQSWTPAVTQDSWSATLPAQPARARERWDTGNHWG